MNAQDSKKDLHLRLLAAAVLLILPPLYFYPALIGNIALVQGDGWSQNLGVRVLIGRMIASGHLPLWNPYIFAGTPLLASIYPGALYPPNWVFALLSPGAAMHLVVITTYHIALIGTYLYARKIGITRAGALIAGIAFTFGGYMIAHLGHTSRIAAGAWLPWVLLAIENLHERVRWRWITLGAVFIALQLFAGEPQMTFYTVLVAGAYWLFSLIGRSGESRIRFTLATGAMSLGGVLLSLVQLLPERELLNQSERAQITYDTFAGYSLPPRQIVTQIFPYFFGGAPEGVQYWGEWSPDEMCGYVGLLTILLGLVAICARGRRPLIWFWAGCAVVSYVLAWGGYLPFGLNHLLHRLPVYNLFRASARHMFEYTFSAGILAGLGVSYLAGAEREAVARAFKRGALIFTVVVAAATILFRFYGDYLVTEIARTPGSGSLLTREGFLPLVFFVLSVTAVWVYARHRTVWTAATLVVVVFADLGAFGHSFSWSVTRMSINKRLEDRATVKFIKEREPDLSAFRIVSYSEFPFYLDDNDMLNVPNISIVRGLQSVNGYDALRLVRMAEIAGDMTSDGQIPDTGAFGLPHQGFNLLNVKYLLRQRPARISEEDGVVYDGIRFEQPLLNRPMVPGSHFLWSAAGTASSLALVTAMSSSTHIADGSLVARIKLYAKDGRTVERELQIGRDTAEWAYDRADVLRSIKHRRARVVEDINAGDFKGHRYLARFDFPRMEIARIELEYVRPDADLLISRASLYDAESGASTPLDVFTAAPERWRRVAEFDPIEIYENLDVRPRVWFVSRIVVAPQPEVLRAIKTGYLRDGTRFDPAEVALLATEDFGPRAIRIPPIGDTAGAEVRVLRYEPQRISLETRQPQPGFMVLSEIYYRGWEAWVDGQRVPVERVNYALRGVALPPGSHRIEMIFRAHSFRTGAVYSALGAGALFACALIGRRRRNQRRDKTV